jgi:hypothetical protein
MTEINRKALLASEFDQWLTFLMDLRCQLSGTSDPAEALAIRSDLKIVMTIITGLGNQIHQLEALELKRAKKDEAITDNLGRDNLSDLTTTQLRALLKDLENEP